MLLEVSAGAVLSVHFSMLLRWKQHSVQQLVLLLILYNILTLQHIAQQLVLPPTLYNNPLKAMPVRK
jgi:hypothetical protein